MLAGFISGFNFTVYYQGVIDAKLAQIHVGHDLCSFSLDCLLTSWQKTFAWLCKRLCRLLSRLLAGWRWMPFCAGDL